MPVSEIRRMFDNIAGADHKISRSEFSQMLLCFDIVRRDKEKQENIKGKDNFLNFYELKNACLGMGFDFFNYTGRSWEDPCRDQYSRGNKGKIDDIVDKIFTEAHVGPDDGLTFTQFKTLPRFWWQFRSRKYAREDMKGNAQEAISPSVHTKNATCYW